MHRPFLIAAVLSGGLAVAAHAETTLVSCTEASPPSLNPQLTTANTAYDVAAQIYNRLVELERGGSTVIPALAESWTISPDGLSYTFRLRRGVKFQSNRLFAPTREFNADDVMFSYTRMSDKANPWYAVGGASYDHFNNQIAASFAGFTRIDDYTVQVKLKSQLGPLLGVMTVEPMSILSAEYAEAMLKAKMPEVVDQNPVGTGPFSLVAYQKDSSVRFRAFPQHWAKAAGMQDRTAQVDNLVFAITPDPSVRLAKLRAGECQIARFPNPADLDAMRKDPQLDLLSGPIADMAFIAFNMQKEPLGNAKVRTALAMAIDKDALVAAVYQGTAQKNAALVPPTLWGRDQDTKGVPFDPARAKALLAEAGFPNGFKSRLWAVPVVRAYMPNGRRAAEMLQADWAKIGVQVEIVSYEWGEYLKRARDGEGEIVMLGGTWDYPDPSQLLNSDWSCIGGPPRPYNLARWCSADYNGALMRANSLTDQNERAKLYVEAQKAFDADVPGVLLANAFAFVGTRKNVRGYKIHVFGGQPYFGVSLN
jgi:dipeptide transport system substrate-binding protein